MADEGSGISPGRRAAAGVAGLLGPGVGHVVIGRLVRGLVWLAAALACLLLMPVFGMWALALFFLVWLASLCDALVTGTGPEGVPGWIFVAGALLVVVTFELAARAALRQLMVTSRIASGTMAPTLLPKDMILTQKVGYRLERGDVVLFRRSAKDAELEYAKRVVALAGDTVAVEHGNLVLNGKPARRTALGHFHDECGDQAELHVDSKPYCVLEEEHLNERSYHVNAGFAAERADADFAAVTVPAGHVFVLGDNRGNSLDSRHFGAVPLDAIVGRVRFVLLGYQPDGENVWWERVNRRVR